MNGSRAIGKSVTIWSVLALVFLVGGGAATFILSQQIMPSWAESGSGHPVGTPFRETMPEGEHYIYYQSNVSVPFPDQVRLVVSSSIDESMEIKRIDDSEIETHTFAVGDIQGRALYKMTVKDADTYSFKATMFGLGEPGDQLVVLKDPQTVADARSQRMMTLILGLALTLVLFIGFYIVHGVTLSRQKSSPPPRFGLGEPLV